MTGHRPPPTVHRPSATDHWSLPTDLAPLLDLLRSRSNLERLDARAPRAWPEIARLAREHDVEALVFRIAQAADLAVPDPIRAQLQRRYYQTVAANAWLFSELARLSRALDKAGIPLIVLKGAALADAVYRDRGVRPMGDLDLLVRREDVDGAIAVARALGYVDDDPEIRPGSTLAFESQVMLHRAAPPHTQVEIHWGLVDSPYYQARLDLQWFWDTAVPMPPDFAGAGASSPVMLGPEAQLLHLCAHLVLHHADEPAPHVRWLHDAAELARDHAEDMDWPLLLARAQDFDLVLPLQAVLPCLADGWHAPVPASARQALADLRPTAAERRIHAQLTRGGHGSAGRLMSDLGGMPGWGRRLRYLWINIVPSAAYMRRRYDVRRPWLLPLYYPYRWLRGILGRG